MIVILLLSIIGIALLNAYFIEPNHYKLEADIVNKKYFDIKNVSNYDFHEIDNTLVIANFERNELYRINEPYQFNISISNITNNKISVSGNFKKTRFGSLYFIDAGPSNELNIVIRGIKTDGSIVTFKKNYKIIEPNNNSELLYQGINNILTVTVPGIPKEKLNIYTLDNKYEIKDLGNGEYLINPKISSDITIMVNVKYSDGHLKYFSKKFKIVNPPKNYSN